MPLRTSGVDRDLANTEWAYRVVRLATTGNITLSGTQTIDGVAAVADDRVLVKNQSSAPENGPYKVKAGAWVRELDELFPGVSYRATEGAQAEKLFVLFTDGTIVVDTTSLVFDEPPVGAAAPLSHATSHTDGSDDIQSATDAQKGLATAAQISKLDNIEPLANVTDEANVRTALAAATASVTFNNQALTTGIGGGLTLSRVAGSTYSTLQDAQNSFHSSGLISGGIVSDAGGETVDATACEVYLRATDNPIAELLFATVPASLGLAIPTDTTKEVGVEWNAGAPQHVVRDVGDWDLKTAFPLATVFNASGVLHIHIDAHDVSDHAGNMIQRSFETMRFARDNDLGGLILSNTGTRNLALTAGAAWARLNRYAIAAKDTSVADTFAVFVGATLDQAAATQWDNANYNLGGVKTALTPNRWAVLWFWIEPEDGDMSCAYGTGQYTSQAAAEDEAVPATLPDLIRYGGLLLGRLVFQEGAATPAQIDSAFAQAFVGSAASDHGNLGGLTDDDHTQYLRADGTRAISGPMDFGGVDHTNLLSIALANAGVSGTVRAIVNAIEVGALSAHAVRLLVGGGTKFQVNASLAVLTGVGIRHATVSFGAGNDAIAITQKIVRKTAITAGGDTITLPVPATAGLGWEAVISDEAGTAGTNHLTVDVSGGANINGVASLKITKDRGRMYVYCTGSVYEAW